ncbi:hypothetical protein M0R72_14305 [Candidatus Pacearchaeota archaeon]|nr:hypothetical protein [Candidatus Pacearchaeota archaeon]
MATRSLSNPKLNLKLSANVVNTLADGTTVTAPQPYLTYAPALANGIVAGQANRGWQQVEATILSGEQVVIDLFDFQGLDIGAGVGNDALGQAMAIQEIVVIIIINKNEAGEAGLLEVLPATGEGWTPIGTHTVAVGGALGAQGMVMKMQVAEAGFDVVDNSHRITLRASGGDVIYSIYVLGRDDDEESSVSSSSVSSNSSSSSASSTSSSSSSSSSVSTSSISTSSSSVSTSSISTSTSSSSSSSASSSSSSSASSTSSSESSSSPSSTG